MATGKQGTFVSVGALLHDFLCLITSHSLLTEFYQVPPKNEPINKPWRRKAW